MDQDKKKCTRKGCLKVYTDEENVEGCCKYHPGKPIFHDTKKGWDCCKKLAYDWDEFQKIEGCATGQHTNIKDQGVTDFWKSQTVTNAKTGLEKADQGDVPVPVPDPVQTQTPKSIDQFNKEHEEMKKKEGSGAPQVDKKPFIAPSGKFKCINKGCNKEFDPESNDETSCHHHPGNPIFHDVKKKWTCCNKETYDWDEFVKIPTCSVGKHNPKMV